MIDTKIADLKEIKKELRRLMRRQYELRCRNVYSDLLSKAECMDEYVRQSLSLCSVVASENRLAEFNALQNAINKIDEQIKKQEGEK